MIEAQSFMEAIKKEEKKKQKVMKRPELEEDADKIILLHPDGKNVLAIVAKNRNGRQGDATLGFNGNAMKFTNTIDICG